MELLPEYFTELNSLVKSDFTEKEYIFQEKLLLPKEFKSLLNIPTNNILGRHALFYIKSRGITEEDIIIAVQDARAHNETVVMTNGCFDILHAGHIRYLEQAKALGHRLIVAVNSDDSVRRLNKAVNRPINSEEARMLLIAALGFVDLVLVFNEETPLDLIKDLQPDVLIKGADYDASEHDSSNTKYIVGSKEVRSYGGAVCTVDFVPGYSTTLILKKGN
jgi:D-beta-D-heptose 7-phosphate kinase/D-beta-D-heptose 1-phosphate adenosyltransferase